MDNIDLTSVYDAGDVVLTIGTFNLNSIERRVCEAAIKRAGSIVEAAQLLGITRHALKRRIVKHNLRWPEHIMPV